MLMVAPCILPCGKLIKLIILVRGEDVNPLDRWVFLVKIISGTHISVTDKKYEQCIQTVLHQSLSAFCVETNQDRAFLQRILDKYTM